LLNLRDKASSSVTYRPYPSNPLKTFIWKHFSFKYLNGNRYYPRNMIIMWLAFFFWSGGQVYLERLNYPNFLTWPTLGQVWSCWSGFQTVLMEVRRLLIFT